MRATLQIEKLIYGGEGLARHGSRAALLPFVLPGESVEARIGPSRGGVLRGQDVRIAKASDDRVAPACPLFSRCGGCHYQHMTDDAEIAHKVRILRETLARIGGVEWTKPIEAVRSEPLGYRNRTQLHARPRGRASRLGFHAPRSHRLVAADECPINSPRLNAVHGALNRMASNRRFPGRLRVIEIFSDEDQVQLNLPRLSRPLPARFWRQCATELGVSHAGAALDYRCGRDVFRVSGRSFFQVNRHLVGRLGQLVVGDCTGDLAIDLYAGVGLLTLPLARRFGEVIAVDSAESAMRDLRTNARRAALAVRVAQMDVSAFLEGWSKRPGLVLADPPRSGLGGPVVERISKLAPSRLHLLSCDPATLSRDLSALLASGYVLDSLSLVDLFPQTYHIETVAKLRHE